MKKRRVGERDSIGSIAYESGLLWETVWLDPQNAELRRRRKNPDVLLQGDVVMVPDPIPKEERASTDAKYRFRRREVPEKLYLRIVEAPEPDEEEPSEIGPVIEVRTDEETPDSVESDKGEPQALRPRAQLPYQLVVDGGISQEGTTDANGLIECDLAPDAQDATLVLHPGAEGEVAIRLLIGRLDPAEEVTGVQERLNNLGFHCGRVDAVVGPRTRDAIARFQSSVGLEATGEPDARTRQKLQEAYEET